MAEFILLFLAVWGLCVAAGFTCIKHNYRKHGPTHHMGYDVETGQLLGWKRYWWVCTRCEKKKPAEKVER